MVQFQYLAKRGQPFATVAYDLDRRLVGWSLCNECDSFDKKRGRKIAQGRLEKHKLSIDSFQISYKRLMRWGTWIDPRTFAIFQFLSVLHTDPQDLEIDFLDYGQRTKKEVREELTAKVNKIFEAAHRG